MNMSLRSRLVFQFIAISALLILGFFTFIYINFSHAIYDRSIIEKFDNELRKTASDLGHYRAEFNSRIRNDFFLSSSYGQLRDYPRQLSDDPLIVIRNIALQDKRIPLSPEAFAALREGRTHIETAREVFPFPLRVVSMKVHDREGQQYILQMGMSMQYISITLAKLLLKFILLGPFLLAVIAGLGYLFVKRALAPVRKIVTTTRQITAQDLSLRLETIESRDEIGELSETLNGMIARLETSFNQIRQFSDDVSHEIKTPLTIMKGEIEVCLRHERPTEEYRDILRSILEEIDKLNRIIENLFFLSRMDSADIAEGFRETDLDKVLLEVFEELSPLAAGKNIALNIQHLAEIALRGDAALLKRLFSNLIVNAVKYTPEGGSVSLSLEEWQELPEKTPPGAVFIIRDNGEGIPERSLPRIFDRFYRVDKSRSSLTGGTGLGLTIVRKILDLHGGKVTVDSREGQGTTFFLFFPKNRNINKH